MYDLVHLPPNFLIEDMYGRRSANFAPIEALFKEADKFIFILPEYNGSFPGVVKLALDAMDPGAVFAGKKAALVGVSTGKFGNLRGLEHFTGALNYMKVEVLPFKAHLMKIDRAFSADQKISDPETLTEIQKQIDAFLKF